MIPQEIETEIMSAKCDYDAASILYRHMTAQAHKESAEKLFNVMINATEAYQKRPRTKDVGCFTECELFIVFKRTKSHICICTCMCTWYLSHSHTYHK